MQTFASLKQVNAGVLSVGYAEEGPAGGTPVVLLHGWPYDIHCFADVAPLLAAAGYRVIVPYLRGHGPTHFLSTTTPRSGAQAAFAVDTIALMDALKIDRAILGGFDWGGRAADIVAALSPERCKALVSVSGYQITNLKATQQPLSPEAELGWWYLFYFSTERGRAGYAKNRHDFNKLIWKRASPKWDFEDATFDRSAPAFENPDYVDIVIDNYRWRLGLAKGDPQYDDPAAPLQAAPVIPVPTITIGCDFDGPAADGAVYRNKFTGKYDHRTLTGIGHNVPQEDPEAFARAVIDVDGLM
jgi:pimeloyl-ACP methyl ester carboxylesterase